MTDLDYGPYDEQVSPVVTPFNPGGIGTGGTVGAPRRAFNYDGGGGGGGGGGINFSPFAPYADPTQRRYGRNGLPLPTPRDLIGAYDNSPYAIRDKLAGRAASSPGGVLGGNAIGGFYKPPNSDDITKDIGPFGQTNVQGGFYKAPQGDKFTSIYNRGGEFNAIGGVYHEEDPANARSPFNPYNLGPFAGF